MASSSDKGDWNILLLQERGQVLEWAVQGGDGVTIPRGVQEVFRCCTEGHSLVGNIGDRWTVGLFQA